MIDGKFLIGMSVVTQSGETLGRVQGFSLDVISHQIRSYSVKTTWALRATTGNELLIASSQVVDITEKTMIVEDLVVPKSVAAISPETAPSA